MKIKLERSIFPGLFRDTILISCGNQVMSLHSPRSNSFTESLILAQDERWRRA